MAFRLPARGGRATSGAAVLCGILLASVAGCGGSSGLSGATAQEELAGTYTLSGLSASRVAVACPNSLSVNGVTVDACVSGETLQMSSNGNYVLTAPATKYGSLYQESGTFSRSGDKLTLTRTSSSKDTNNDGTFQTSETTKIDPSQKLVATIVFGDNSFTITPIQSESSSLYTVALSVDDSPVSLTYTRQP